MAGFFRIGCQVDEIEIKELLLHRYHTLEFIQGMQIDEFAKFLTLAIENDKKEKAYMQYTALLPLMIRADKYMSFSTFYDEMTGANIDWRPANEILKEAEEIQRKQNGNGNL